MEKSNVLAAKRNFWNDLRVKNNYSYKELADVLGTNIGTVGNWFSGRVVPRSAAMKAVCDLFGVDYDTGKAEFEKAHASWSPEFGRASKGAGAKHPKFKASDVSAKPEVKPQPAIVELMSTLPEEPQPAAAEPNVQIPTFLKILYGKVSVEEYEYYRAVGLTGDDPLEALYNKISFDDFVELYRLING